LNFTPDSATTSVRALNLVNIEKIRLRTRFISSCTLKASSIEHEYEYQLTPEYEYDLMPERCLYPSSIRGNPWPFFMNH
jgi:hypothetical protein